MEKAIEANLRASPCTYTHAHTTYITYAHIKNKSGGREREGERETDRQTESDSWELD